MNLLESIWNGICNFISAIVDFVIEVIQGIFNFAKYVIQYFKDKVLDRLRHKPFIGNANKFPQNIKEMIKNAPQKDVGIFRGVYDEQADEITDFNIVESYAVDEETEQVLGNEALVVLR